MSKIKKFKVYLITNEPKLKVWQELRDLGVILNYTAACDSESKLWVLYSKASGKKTEGPHGDEMRRFKDIESLCMFLGVVDPSKTSDI